MNMQNKKYDLIVYIGRFQPDHNGHQATRNHARTLSDNVLVLIGSANGPRTTRNPWTYQERVDAISDNTPFDGLHFEPLTDYSYNDNKWIQQVGGQVNKTVSGIKKLKGELFDAIRNEQFKIAVIGHDKDHSSFYLNYFPQWDYIEMPAFPANEETIDSTRIRQLMFSNQVSFTDGVVPGSQVRDFISSKAFFDLQKEWDANEAYKDSWKAAPYPVNFTTVDAVVEQSGHVLLIQRGGFPGYGLWAMPGGFLDTTEKVEDGVIRELREETKLKVPEKVLRGSIKHLDFFDDVERSTRGRTITFTALIQLDDAAALPKVKGSSDALDAQWFSLAEFDKMQGVMFEDHYSIIKNMLARA
jgi:bifunctional NMN adenylyltransferase/nudix hydrolase